MESPTPRSSHRRYAFVGTGHRAEVFLLALLTSHADVGEPVALCDTNPGRMAYYQKLRDGQLGGVAPLPEYPPERFDDMVRDERPDVVVVTSPDHTHASYITRALGAGVDVITEKPMTIDEAGVRGIVAAVQSSDADLTVTFNYRYSPRNSALRGLIADGAVGEVTSVHFEWLLDTVHGADYFRRWHREKTLSGGLLVHKSTHHFDLVNWWLDDEPRTVFALGGLRFYGAANAARRGLPPRSDRTHGSGALDDPFALDLQATERLRALYLDAERFDGYVRDRDVFSGGISIEDNLAVLVGYERGAALTYSLNAHSPWEGYRVAVNGTEGRAELEVIERAAVQEAGAGGLVGRGRRHVVDPSAQESPGNGGVRATGARLTLQRHWEAAEEVSIPAGRGSHGGGDALLLDDLFRGADSSDPLRRQADYADGARSVLVGHAANVALATGRPVHLAPGGLRLADASSQPNP